MTKRKPNNPAPSFIVTPPGRLVHPAVRVAPPGAKPIPMYKQIRQHCDLAVTYAEDGAYHRAAEILQEVADLTKHHAQYITRMIGS